MEFPDVIFKEMEKIPPTLTIYLNPEPFLKITIVIIQANSDMCIKKTFCYIFFLLSLGGGIQHTEPQELNIAKLVPTLTTPEVM